MSLLRLARPRLLCACIQPIPARTFSLTASSRSNNPTDPPTDPKTHIQSELKAALRAKDTPRLNVLRSVLASITNASKTSTPITLPSHLYTLLSKQISASTKAISEFEAANRDDLVQKEKTQVEILEGYRNGIESLGKEDLDVILKGLAKEGAELKFGELMKRAQAEIKGRPYDTQYLVEKLKALASKS
ncbi:hypothetical protein K505DRAFT_328526 [Melanomma pulvis-pyrius CBS 109.77]|uniref:Altered inheritance of mitochondria protein 41 n=1 Tax=Melanomma pulvis-pyrius CBS 109.77 TaxID=1314802 RepID=A0A6A6WYK1_9PLEO|nr:hypothetical protein K505DRAFT_328526 [Melanomma pulvis-pyrius CBS 109.77]